MNLHTPTPWHVNPAMLRFTGPGADQGIMTDRKYIADVVQGARNMPEGTTQEEARANAAFIVRAVNAHDVLVSALSDMLRMVQGNVSSAEERGLIMDRAVGVLFGVKGTV